MKKRMIIMLATVLVVVGGLGLVKYKQVQTAIAQASSFVPPPEAVTTLKVQEERWPATLGAIGTTQAVQGVREGRLDAHQGGSEALCVGLLPCGIIANQVEVTATG